MVVVVVVGGGGVRVGSFCRILLLGLGSGMDAILGVLDECPLVRCCTFSINAPVYISSPRHLSLPSPISHRPSNFWPAPPSTPNSPSSACPHLSKSPQPVHPNTGPYLPA